MGIDLAHAGSVLNRRHDPVLEIDIGSGIAVNPLFMGARCKDCPIDPLRLAPAQKDLVFSHPDGNPEILDQVPDGVRPVRVKLLGVRQEPVLSERIKQMIGSIVESRIRPIPRDQLSIISAEDELQRGI